jgi:hypothetical protein
VVMVNDDDEVDDLLRNMNTLLYMVMENFDIDRSKYLLVVIVVVVVIGKEFLADEKVVVIWKKF